MKIKKNINEEEFFKQVLASIPEDVKQSVNLSMAIAVQINFILKKKNISQREFANLLGKKESEISKWLSGNHNFTTNTVGKIQSVLGEEIISVPIYSKKEIKFIPVHTYSHSFQDNKSEKLNVEYPFTNIDLDKNWEIIVNCDNGCYGTEIIN